MNVPVLVWSVTIAILASFGACMYEVVSDVYVWSPSEPMDISCQSWFFVFCSLLDEIADLSKEDLKVVV